MIWVFQKAGTIPRPPPPAPPGRGASITCFVPRTHRRPCEGVPAALYCHSPDALASSRVRSGLWQDRGTRPAGGSEIGKPRGFLLEQHSIFSLVTVSDAERKERTRESRSDPCILYSVANRRALSTPQYTDWRSFAIQLYNNLRLTVHLRLLNLKRKMKSKPRNPPQPKPPTTMSNVAILKHLPFLMLTRCSSSVKTQVTPKLKRLV